MLSRFALPRRALPAFVVVTALSVLTIFFANRLQDRADRARAAEASLTRVSMDVRQAHTAPSSAGGLAESRARWDIAERRFEETVGYLKRTYRTEKLGELEEGFKRLRAASMKMLDTLPEDFDFSGLKFPPEFARNIPMVLAQSDRVDKAMRATAADYESRAGRATNQARFGSAAMMLILLIAFTLFLRRSVLARATAERLMRENEKLLAISHHDARTDVLTGMPNRRALADDLEAAFSGGEEPVLTIVMYDLDGFKAYNDRFGHPSGDDLLTRVGASLSDEVCEIGKAYRMGGDEFCVVARCGEADAKSVAERGAQALATSGDGYNVTASFGYSMMPHETRDGDEAFDLADRRLYAEKATRRGSRFRTSDDRRLLMQILMEQSSELAKHGNGVAALAAETAREMGLPASEIERIRTAAELHDIGKTAIPDSVLNKPGALNEDEWRLMRSHTLVGERIVHAAPGLAEIAELVRSSHERVDGTGYPDGLKGDEIPLGSRIIFVSDSFDAMITDRPYRKGMSVPEALDEIRRNTGSQFDVEAARFMIAVIERRNPDELAA